jgi:hypothetical protein
MTHSQGAHNMKKYPDLIISGFFLLILAGGPSVLMQAEESAGISGSVESRLQNLEDREEIRALLIEYGRLLDKEDLAGYSKLFAKDGVWEGGIGLARGPEGIEKMLEEVFGRVAPGQYGNSYHIMSDITINTHGDTATSWSRWTWIVEGSEGKPELQRAGHYEDTLVRENGDWKFKHRLTVTELPTEQNDTETKIWRKDYRDDEDSSD